MYFVIALLISLVTVLGFSVIGGLSANPKRVGKCFTMGLIGAVAYTVILYLVYWLAAIGFYGPTPYFWSIVLGSIVGLIISGFSSAGREDFAWKATIPSGIIAILYILYAFGVIVFNSDIFTAQEKGKLIGEVKNITDISKVLEPADPVHICLVSGGMAKVKANAALSKFKVAGDIVPGSRYKIGEPTKQFVDGQLWWIFPVEFQGWLKWRQDKQVPGYLRISAENPFQDAQAVQVNKQGKEISIKYLNSACFEYRADRYTRYNGYMGCILQDWTFEVDDDWNPFYTVSVLTRKFGYSGYYLEGIATLDLQSGKIKYCPNNNLPDWLDRAQPLNVIDWQVKKWGEYAHSTWGYNFFHNDKSQMPTPGWYLTYNTKGVCQWFSGFTSKNVQDQALTGFILVDSSAPGSSSFFRTSGVTEGLSYKSARSLWSNFEGYEPQEMMPYNFYGTLTYVIPVAYQGQFKGVSLVSLNNIDVNARGNTLEEALSNYRAMIAKAPGSAFAPAGGALKIIEIKGRVARVGMPMLQGQQQIFVFSLEGVPKIFQGVYSYKTPKTPLLEKGDEVVITCLETQEKVITCETLDVPAIPLSDESPNQGRYIKTQKIVGQEVERISQEEARGKLLDSDRLKKVSPEALEKFIEEQSN